MNLQQTGYIQTSQQTIRADFDKAGFDRLISEKGREVELEKAIQCPCKGNSTNQLSSCRNCGGTGWIFTSPVRTRMILSGIDVSTKYAPWSEEARGGINITAMMEEEISYMDKIKVTDGKSTFAEALSVRKTSQGIYFVRTAYQVERMFYIGVYQSDSVILRPLTSADYAINKEIIIFNPNVIVGNNDEISITVRYQHAPAFHIIEFKRDTMQSFTLKGTKEELIDLPISAYAKRAHYQMKATNISNNWLLDNNITL